MLLQNLVNVNQLTNLQVAHAVNSGQVVTAADGQQSMLTSTQEFAKYQIWAQNHHSAPAPTASVAKTTLSDPALAAPSDSYTNKKGSHVVIYNNPYGGDGTQKIPAVDISTCGQGVVGYNIKHISAGTTLNLGGSGPCTKQPVHKVPVVVPPHKVPVVVPPHKVPVVVVPPHKVPVVVPPHKVPVVVPPHKAPVVVPVHPAPVVHVLPAPVQIHQDPVRSSRIAYKISQLPESQQTIAIYYFYQRGLLSIDDVVMINPNYETQQEYISYQVDQISLI